jgi:hypothetical protein
MAELNDEMVQEINDVMHESISMENITNLTGNLKSALSEELRQVVEDDWISIETEWMGCPDFFRVKIRMRVGQAILLGDDLKKMINFATLNKFRFMVEFMKQEEEDSYPRNDLVFFAYTGNLKQ